MLTAAELAALRATNQALPGSAGSAVHAAIRRMGGYEQAWAAVGTIAARLYPQNVRSMAENTAGGAAVISETRWFVTLPYGSTVTAADRLVIDNRTWEIYEVNNSEMYQTAVRCEVYAFGEERRV